MLLLHCPFCGPRAEIEFRCGGEGHIQRPGPHTDVSDAEWANYLYYRENPKGAHRERWCHSAGCGRWFNVARDTTTHRILATYGMTEHAPFGDGRGGPAGDPAMSPGAATGGAS